MKRCPQCLFIYPDTDSRCDFDNTPLVVADEAEINAAITPPAPEAPKQKRRAKSGKRKTVIVTSLVGLFLCLVISVAYFSLSKRSRRGAQTVTTIGMPAGRIPLEPAIVAATPVPTPSSSPSPVEPAKPAQQRIATAHTNTTIAPVSTSGPGLGKKLGGKPLILLTSGGKIEADEVWRTKDGVWYRRDGIVTLLKQGRVKAIVNQ